MVNFCVDDFGVFVIVCKWGYLCIGESEEFGCCMVYFGVCVGNECDFVD